MIDKLPMRQVGEKKQTLKPQFLSFYTTDFAYMKIFSLRIPQIFDF